MPKVSLDNKNITKLDVRILRSLFVSMDSDFGIYEVEILNSKSKDVDEKFAIPAVDNSIVTGNFENRMFYGEEYLMYGELTKHPKYGLQYKVHLVQNKFDTPDRVRAFLNLHVAQSIADQLIELYGSEVLDRIVNNDVDYSKVKGMGEKRFNALREKVLENIHMKDVIGALSPYGITPLQMKRIIALFGANAIKKVEENPYNLCKVHGIGFLKADDVANRMGYPRDSVHRIHEGIKYALVEAQKEGHTWVERGELLDKATSLLVLEEGIINKEIDNIEGVKVIGDKVTLTRMYNAEAKIANFLKELNDNPIKLEFDVDGFLERKQKQKGIKLTDQQKSLFYKFLEKRVIFLIGNAGSGKTQVSSMLLEMIEEMNLTYVQVSPTGRAAKIQSLYTGKPASTYHRQFGIFGSEADQTKECYADVIIGDESSMVGVLMLPKALAAIKNSNVRMVFVGDDFQIPSVEVGNFLHDSIESGALPVVKLTQVFRQKDGGILDVATKVRLKEKFLNNDFKGTANFGSDMILYSVPQTSMEKGFLYCYKQALEKYSSDEIVILSPTNKGSLGTRAINRQIQELVNPKSNGKAEVSYGKEVVFRVGDRVINIKNNYKALNVFEQETTVFNGDVGVIESINVANRELVIDYTFDKIVTKFDQLDTLMHGYCLSKHRSQGGGYDCVIVIADKAHKWQLNANLLYTGLTRAKKFLYLICQADVINQSMGKNVSLLRNTFLKDFLRFDGRIELDYQGANNGESDDVEVSDDD